MQKKIPLLTPEELVKQRVTTCQTELNSLLEKYNCALDCSITLGQNAIKPQIFVVALKDQPKSPVTA